MRTVQRSLVLSAVLALLLLAPSAASALTQADLDASYGTAGAATPALPAISSGFTVATQADGKTVGGYTATGNVPMVFRLNTDGSLDSSFGAGGIVNLAVLGATAINVDRILVAADGTIYAVGDGSLAGNVRDAVWALTSTGAPKLSFNATGSILLPIVSASNNDIGDAALTPAGDVAVFAEASPGVDTGLSLRVVTPTGAVTTNVTKVFAGYDASPISISVLPDGRFLGAITVEGTSDDFGGLVAFSAAGVWDPAFGGSGLSIFGPPIPLFSVPFRTFNLNGRIAALGMVGYTPALAVYGSDGIPIPEVGTSGTSRLLPPGASFAILADGAAVAGGKVAGVGLIAGPTPRPPFMVRFNPDGTPDASFVPGGIASVPGPGGGLPQFALQPDGKYVIAYSTTDDHLRLVRIWGDSPAPQSATVAFSSSVKSRNRASKSKRFAGTTGGTGVTSVDLAIQKVDSKLLKKSKKCAYVKNLRTGLKNAKAVSGKCVPNVWLRAKGTASWSLKLSKALPPGKYVLSARATGFLGLSPIVTKSITLTK